MLGTNNHSHGRQFFLDWLRIAAFGILVPYHTLMYYVTWTYHVKSPFASRDLEPFMMLSSPWRMSLLFLISGAATAYMFKHGASGALIKSRTRRLLIPLLVGILLVVPPQSYYEVVYRFNYQGSFWDFLSLYYRPSKSFCDAQGCLILPTWNHLWFLPYLWCYTFVLWLALRLRPKLLDSAAGMLIHRINFVSIILLPIAILYLIRLGLYARFPQSYDVVHDWFSHAQYFFMFLIGALFARIGIVWDQFVRWRWFGLIGWLTAWALFLLTRGKVSAAAQMLIVVTLLWCAVVAAIGFARRWLERDHPWRKTLTEAVFPVYIFHQTIIIVLSQWLLPLQWNPWLEAPIIILCTFLISFGAYRLVRRMGWFGRGFGLN